MKIPSTPIAPGFPRFLLMLSSWLYAIALHVTHIYFLNQDWEYWGFSYSAPGLKEMLIMFVLVTLGAALLPTVMTRASTIILLLLFEVVYVPTVVITLSLIPDSLEHYGFSLVMLSLGFSIACFCTRLRPRGEVRAEYIPGDQFCKVFLYCWLVCAALLIAKYGAIMSFVGLEDVYAQRAASISDNIFVGYLQTYFSNILSPALMALGLIKSRKHLFFLGVVGCILMYMISAQRTIFLLPVVMVIQFLLLRSRFLFFRTSALPLLVLSVIVVAVTFLYRDNAVAGLLSTYLVFRTLAIPGLSFSQYFDLFDKIGFTWWSHIKGLDALVGAPASLVNDPSWPELGHIVGEQVYRNVENNVNANLFCGDGAAACGALGVLVIGIVLTIWLRLLDRSTAGWNRNLTILLVLPVGLSLTNGPFFTTMLSFGGVFWLLIFYLFKPGMWAWTKARLQGNRAGEHV